MSPESRRWFSCVLACVLTAMAVLVWQKKQSPVANPPRIKLLLPANGLLTLQGPGGRVSLGDTLDQAKKAFPPPSGAKISGSERLFDPRNKRSGWSWYSDKAPAGTFEVSLEQGRITGILQSSSMLDRQAAQKLLDQTTRRLGKPSHKKGDARMARYSWISRPNARFLMLIHRKIPKSVQPEHSNINSLVRVQTLIGDECDWDVLQPVWIGPPPDRDSSGACE